MKNIHRFHWLTCLPLAAGLAFMGTAAAADAPATNEVLAKLHESNQKEIAMGKLAQKNGHSKDLKGFGAMLVKDHSAADKKVMGLAKKEKIDLPISAPASHDDMANGPDFDSMFAKAMLDDHKKDVAEATSARDNTKDEQLKKLLTAMIPTLQKHQDTAQRLVDQPNTETK